MANQAAVNTIIGRIKQLKEQQQELRQGIIAAEIIKDGSTDSVTRLIKEGQTANASAISTQVQQPAAKAIENNLQQLVTTERSIAQLNAQVARLTGQIPPEFANELGVKTSADLQQLLLKDPAAFERATVDIYTSAARRSADALREQLNTIDFGDERLQVIPSIPSAIVYVTNPAGFSQAETLEQNANQQYQRFILEEATRAIPQYANGAAPPPVAVSTALPGTTGGAALTRVQNPTPQPQTVPGGRDIAIATGLAVAGSAALAFLNNRGNIVPTNTPQVPAPSLATPPIAPQQPVTAADPQSGGFVFDPITGEQVPANSVEAQSILAGENAGILRTPAPLGLTESETIPGFTTDPRAAGENVNPLDAPAPVGLTESEVIPEFTADPRAAGENTDSVRDQALRDNLRNQQAIAEQRRNNANSADWRVRLRLAPASQYLYNAQNPGILQPLKDSDGVIFPYTPTIQTVYKASYNSYDLTHSNYRGYFYQSSQVDDIQITGTFTAQDTSEAEYLLAVIHFFRSATKMFYGQDPQRGAPPPLVFLSAFGQFQYVNAPCVIAQFNYNLPADVDYIRARSPNQNGTNLLKRRDRKSLPSFLSFSPPLQRLYQSRLRKGGDPRIEGENVGSVLTPPTLGLNSPTYVPTRMDITIVLHPMQSRKQVSQQFSLNEYGTGGLQPKGYW